MPYAHTVGLSHFSESIHYDAQVMNLWERNGDVRSFVFGKRLARIAAELMEASSPSTLRAPLPIDILLPTYRLVYSTGR